MPGGVVMAGSKGSTVLMYLKGLRKDRRDLVSAARKVILKNLPRGYEESIDWGMITYSIPLAKYADTYNGRPLCYVGLASQKNHVALYMMGVYADKKLEKLMKQGFKNAGKKLDMGKSCLRFRSLEDVPWNVIGKVIAAMPPQRMIKLYEAGRRK